MATKIKILFLLFLAIPVLSFSQKEEKTSIRKQRKIEAVKQITELKNGVLLVRLKTKQKTLEAMRKAKKLKLADRTEQELLKRNQLIVNGFKSKFDFCSVYFFTSDYTKFITNKELKTVAKVIK